jgi:hypothetical protein
MQDQNEQAERLALTAAEMEARLQPIKKPIVKLVDH